MILCAIVLDIIFCVFRGYGGVYLLCVQGMFCEDCDVVWVISLL